MEKYWTYDPKTHSYVPTDRLPEVAVPTIVDLKQKTAYCWTHRIWEPIKSADKTSIRIRCGKICPRPFLTENSFFIYGYEFSKVNGIYSFSVYSQVAFSDLSLQKYYRDLFTFNPETREVKRNSRFIDNLMDITSLPKELKNIMPDFITQAFIDELGKTYLSKFGIRPPITIPLTGLPLVIAYMCFPFNMKFYKIARFWTRSGRPGDAIFSGFCTPDAENNMFESMGIKPTKVLRKTYQTDPRLLVCYAIMHKAGFTDVNILQKSMTSEFYYFLMNWGHYIDFTEQQSFGIYNLCGFTRDMLKIADQVTVWNSLMRTLRISSESDEAEISATDCFEMYFMLGDTNLTEDERKMLLREGMNKFSHDFLVQRYNAVYPKSVKQIEDCTFILDQAILDLQCKIKCDSEWDFLVARDSDTLRKIGGEMQNCVYSYRNQVKQRECTIVYAVNNKRHKICIELNPGFTIRQALGPYNNTLTGEALKAFVRWCQKKHLEIPYGYRKKLAVLNS